MPVHADDDDNDCDDDGAYQQTGLWVGRCYLTAVRHEITEQVGLCGISDESIGEIYNVGLSIAYFPLTIVE